MRLARAALQISMTSALLGQPAATLPKFEVASVKPSTPGSPGVIYRYPGGRFQTTWITLKTLITYAYGVSEAQVLGGPAWLNTDHFDIVATPEIDAGSEQAVIDRQVRVMLQGLLAERFQLELRHEAKDQPVYALTPAKSGPKLVQNSGKPFLIRRGRDKVTFQKMSLPRLAVQLSGELAAAELGRVVVDQTGLSGDFDFTLAWAPATSSGERRETAPTLFTAVEEQLGLRLQPGRAPVPVLVVLRAEQPSAN
jgi:bla regulator protein BlaR1